MKTEDARIGMLERHFLNFEARGISKKKSKFDTSTWSPARLFASRFIISTRGSMTCVKRERPVTTKVKYVVAGTM